MTKPEDRGLTWGDVELIVRAAEKANKPVVEAIVLRCNVDLAIAAAWARKVGKS